MLAAGMQGDTAAVLLKSEMNRVIFACVTSTLIALLFALLESESGCKPLSYKAFKNTKLGLPPVLFHANNTLIH